MISGYNAIDLLPGPRAFGSLLFQRATLQTPLETVVEGVEQLPAAINMLFDGKNVGELLVKTAG